MNTIKTITISAMILGATGCAKMFTIGNPEYACKGVPDGVRCLGVHDVYRLTDGDDYKEQIHRVAVEATGTEVKGRSSLLGKFKGKKTGQPRVGPKTMNTKPTDKPEPEENDGSETVEVETRREIRYTPTVVTREVRAPIPVRVPARIMRVLISPWESEDDALHVPGYVYLEIEKRKWTIGDRAKASTTTLRPLQVKRPVKPKQQ